MSVAAEPFSEEDDRFDVLDQSKWPEQGDLVGRTAEVQCGTDCRYEVTGKVIRHDTDTPFLIIIKLEDGRIIMNRPLKDMQPCDGSEETV